MDALGLRVIKLTDLIGVWIGMLLLRFLMFWEYWESGMTKLTGDNWFEGIKESLLFPFSEVPTYISWELATWGELLGATAILLGIGTRFFAASLIVVTIVAITSSVHWPVQGIVLSGEGVSGFFNSLMESYAVTNKDEGAYNLGNIKLGLLYIAMLTVLVFYGPGRASFDHLVKRIAER